MTKTQIVCITTRGMYNGIGEILGETPIYILRRPRNKHRFLDVCTVESIVKTQDKKHPWRLSARSIYSNWAFPVNLRFMEFRIFGNLFSAFYKLRNKPDIQLLKEGAVICAKSGDDSVTTDYICISSHFNERENCFYYDLSRISEDNHAYGEILTVCNRDVLHYIHPIHAVSYGGTNLRDE